MRRTTPLPVTADKLDVPLPMVTINGKPADDRSNNNEIKKTGSRISFARVAGITALLKGVSGGGHSSNVEQGDPNAGVTAEKVQRGLPKTSGDICRIEDSPYRIMKVSNPLFTSVHFVT